MFILYYIKLLLLLNKHYKLIALLLVFVRSAINIILSINSLLLNTNDNKIIILATFDRCWLKRNGAIFERLQKICRLLQQNPQLSTVNRLLQSRFQGIKNLPN